MDHKESSSDLRDPSRAPEVAYTDSPKYVTTGHEHDSGKEAIVQQPMIEPDADHAYYGEPAMSQQRPRWYRRKRWLLAIALLVVVIVAAAVGAGIGASRSGGDDQSNNSAPSPTPTTTDGPVSSASSVAVSPATSGITAYSCTNGTTMLSAQPAGLAYIEHCNTMYEYNSPSIFGSSDPILGLFTSTKYDFQSCVDACDDWNDDNPDAEAPCLSVSFYSNLTNVFTERQDWGGNCVLKSGVGGVTTNNTENTSMDWPHIMSAYRACLQQGTPCDSS